jgi:enamine deaminase RidA (YjgF/YER057c/UK114 family)
LDEIDRDYAEFNLSRNEFFERHNVQRLPASTGIRAGLYPSDSLCSFDLYSLLNPEGVDIEVMHTPTLNEADEYGSAFSRGMKVALPEKTVLYISGTASVDEKGDTVHLDDVRRQVERMLLNVRELLRPHDSTFADVVQVITYLKRASYLPTFAEIWRRWGLTGLPNTFVEAGVCRPDLLCELEAIAILPKS